MRRTAQNIGACRTTIDTRHSPALPVADAVAANLSSLATATGNGLVGDAAAAIAEACTAAMVPKPPVSFDAISACVNTAMVTLNTTVFGVTSA